MVALCEQLERPVCCFCWGSRGLISIRVTDLTHMSATIGNMVANEDIVDSCKTQDNGDLCQSRCPWGTEFLLIFWSRIQWSFLKNYCRMF